MKTRYDYVEPLPENKYQKVKVTHKKCGCVDHLCRVGMERGVSCKHCNPRTIQRDKSPIPEHKITRPKPDNIWGTVYYIKLLNQPGIYKIGISEKTVTGRFNSKIYEPIFEIPCKSKSEALAIERLILEIYKADLCVTHDPTFYLEDAGRKECFVRDVLGSNFDVQKFVHVINNALERYQSSTRKIDEK